MPTDERFTHIGKHLIDGDWVSGDNSFRNKPIEGPPDSFPVGSARHVDEAARAAERAFPGYARLPRRERAAFVRRIADEIEERAEAITHFGALETGLPHARLEGERGRTTGQLRLFAGHVEDGNYLDRRHEEAL